MRAVLFRLFIPVFTFFGEVGGDGSSQGVGSIARSKGEKFGQDFDRKNYNTQLTPQADSRPLQTGDFFCRQHIVAQ